MTRLKTQEVAHFTKHSLRWNTGSSALLQPFEWETSLRAQSHNCHTKSDTGLLVREDPLNVFSINVF